MQRYFTITQLTQEFDITTRTLRFYEAQGLVAPTRRGRQRLYTPGDRTRIKLILRGKRLGFSLNEIKEMIEMYASAPGETGQLRLLLDKIAARREELLEKQRDIELTLLELDEVEAGAHARMSELDTSSLSEDV
ncbi:MAG: MerR family DNA-binding transcriptional regulator [Roseibium sp.]|uniref:MerR family transcriptional regulator n=1 Tax=Roseibium sp. TaxID=1936156 RepID=UPI001B07B7C3|nr:MerR family DNA-binding transcriptional regulator [Roseibium sp.]MBO6509904.1 MerR family DNA-binding transcriptional regulator [Roseibium sp.]MBO6894335.1 MerR family DNA-binding transcriptional regulator [Roseibium sp.]MBO6931909.1 MerR family DNA-binding transcriptional regulator [Roseibium sp.]